MKVQNVPRVWNLSTSHATTMLALQAQVSFSTTDIIIIVSILAQMWWSSKNLGDESTKRTKGVKLKHQPCNHHVCITSLGVFLHYRYHCNYSCQYWRSSDEPLKTQQPHCYSRHWFSVPSPTFWTCIGLVRCTGTYILHLQRPPLIRL